MTVRVTCVVTLPSAAVMFVMPGLRLVANPWLPGPPGPAGTLPMVATPPSLEPHVTWVVMMRGLVGVGSRRRKLQRRSLGDARSGRRDLDRHERGVGDRQQGRPADAPQRSGDGRVPGDTVVATP